MPRENKFIASFSYFIGCKNSGWPKSEEYIIPTFYFNCLYNSIPILSLVLMITVCTGPRKDKRTTSLIHNHINNNIKHYCK